MVSTAELNKKKTFTVKKRKLDKNGRVIALICSDGVRDYTKTVKEICSDIFISGHEFIVKGQNSSKSVVEVRLVTTMDGNDTDNISSLPIAP